MAGMDDSTGGAAFGRSGAHTTPLTNARPKVSQQTAAHASVRTPRRQMNHVANRRRFCRSRSAPTPTPVRTDANRVSMASPTLNWLWISAQPSRRQQLLRQFSDQSLDAEQDADLVYAIDPGSAPAAGLTVQEAPRRRAQPALVVPEHPRPSLAAAPPRSASAATADPVAGRCWRRSALFADCAQRGDDLIVGRLPLVSAGTGLPNRSAPRFARFARLDPSLIEAGAGGRYWLNCRAWCHPIALTAIRHHWRQ